MNNTISVKVAFLSDIRRIPLEESAFTYTHLVNLCLKLFQQDLEVPEGSQVVFCYTDEEKDIITCSSDFCLEEALRLHRLKNNQQLPLRLELVVKKNKVQNNKVVRFAPVKDLVEEKLDTMLKKVDPSPSVQPHILVPQSLPPPPQQQQQEQVPLPDYVDDKFVHPARCDKCDQTIVGIRYKCRKCPDFDYCHTCYSVRNDHSADHPFVKMFKSKKNQPPRVCPAKDTKAPQVQPQVQVQQPQVQVQQPQVQVQQPQVQVQQPQVQNTQANEAFTTKLSTLEELGFVDRARNIKVLVEKKGDLSATISSLLENQF